VAGLKSSPSSAAPYGVVTKAASLASAAVTVVSCAAKHKRT
jgi:hypothetical protein